MTPSNSFREDDLSPLHPPFDNTSMMLLFRGWFVMVGILAKGSVIAVDLAWVVESTDEALGLHQWWGVRVIAWTHWVHWFWILMWQQAKRCENNVVGQCNNQSGSSMWCDVNWCRVCLVLCIRKMVSQYVINYVFTSNTILLIVLIVIFLLQMAVAMAEEFQTNVVLLLLFHHRQRMERQRRE